MRAHNSLSIVAITIFNSIKTMAHIIMLLGVAAFTGMLRLERLRVLDLHHNELTQVPYLDKLPSLNELFLQSNSLKSLSRLEGTTLLKITVN